MTDIGWEGIPNWIVAVTATLTLGAAIFAGVFARKAALHTQEQAVASHEQVRIAEQSLKIAHDEAISAQEAGARQRREADRAYRSIAESRLDPLAPVILATATPFDLPDGKQWLELHRLESGYDSWTPWEPVTKSYEESVKSGVEFRTELILIFKNVSDQIARISVVDHGNGQIDDVPSGTDIIIPPHEMRKFVWTKRWGLGMLASEGDINNPANWLFNLSFWVRDLGMNVRDTYKFNGDLRLFERDGSRLVVKNEPYFVWKENVATPMPGRTYERLDASITET